MNESRPIALVRGLPNSVGHRTAADLIRPKSVDADGFVRGDDWSLPGAQRPVASPAPV